MKLLKKFAAFAVCGAFLFGAACEGTVTPGGEPVKDDTVYAVTTAELTDTGADQERWLSLPDSEIVLNPFHFEPYSDTPISQTEYFNTDSLKLGLGVLEPDSQPVRADNVLAAAALNNYGGFMYAKSYSTAWRPDRLEYTASYDNGLNITAYDYFYDARTVVRNMEYNDGRLTVWGGYAAGSARNFKLENGAFVYKRTDGLTVAIAASANTGWKFHGSLSDFEDNLGVSETPGQTGIWRLSPDGGSGVFSVSVAVGRYGDSTEDVIAAAKRPYSANNYISRMSERESEWNGLLAKAPLPQSFELPGLSASDKRGVTERDVKLYYYRSIAQVISNLLPAGNNFAYRSLSVGKPSLWAAGDSKCKYSCVWESLFGTQIYSLIDSGIAWELCLGNMAIIPESGNIAGESLPSTKAQTVWICYSAERDLEKLADCVEPLTNYLNWRFENPRWIFNEHNYEDEKDLDFAAAFLVDLKFMVKICNELGDAQAAAYWAAKGAEMYENIKVWFLPAGETPRQYYFTETGRTIAGTPLWISKTLWAEQTEGGTLSALLDYTLNQYDASAAFAGFGGVKYDDWAYTLYGLIKNGFTEQSKVMLQAGVRDIIKSGYIGEVYNANLRGTVCEGVRPSMFGAIIMIDSVWLLNGYMYHEGGLGAVNLFEREAGVSNIKLNGAVYSVKTDGSAGKVVINKNGAETEHSLSLGSMADYSRTQTPAE